MSLLATLGLELDRALLPASGLGWLVDYGKLPLAPAPLGPYEVLGGALEGGLPGGGEPLAGKKQVKKRGGLRWRGVEGQKRKNLFIHKISTEGLQCAQPCSSGARCRARDTKAHGSIRRQRWEAKA